MEIRGIEKLSESFLVEQEQEKKAGFQQVLTEGIKDLNQLQVKSIDMGDRLAAGEDLEIHDVMIAGQEADIALRLATQLRNQALEAYREVMRMPI